MSGEGISLGVIFPGGNFLGENFFLGGQGVIFTEGAFIGGNFLAAIFLIPFALYDFLKLVL